MGIAIGKCGNRGSKLTDLDIIAGYVTASQNLSQEMVTSDETSKFDIENLKGGSKRLIVYSTWGNEVSTLKENTDLPEIPVITSMLQISGPEMEDISYNKILQFIQRLNDEIIFRYMHGELTPERTIDPIIYWDILDHITHELYENNKNPFGESNKTLEDLVKQSLKKIFQEDKGILKKLLSKMPLRSTCNQEKYNENVEKTKKFIQEELREFLEFERDLTHIRKKIIYEENDSFLNIRKHAREYQNKKEARFQNKRALSVGIEKIKLKINNLISGINTVQKNKLFKAFIKLKKTLPNLDEIEEFLIEINQQFSEDKNSQILNKLNSLANFNEKEINRNLIEVNKIEKSEAKESFLNLSEMKKTLKSIISLIKKLAIDGKSEYSDKLRKEFEKSMTKNIKLNNSHKSALLNSMKGTNDSESEMQTVLKLNLEYMELNNERNVVLKDYRKYVNKRINQIRGNLIAQIIDSVFKEIFQSYRNFKYVLTYSGDIKALIIRKIANQINLFLHEILKFSFASLLDRCLKKVKTGNLKKYYTVILLRNFIDNYLYENFIENPFAIKKKTPVIALDSYSISFISEIVQEAGLDSEIYEIITELRIPDNYKEKFIQILDSTNNRPNIIISKLKDSVEILDNWLKKIDLKLEKLGKNSKEISIKEFLKNMDDFVSKNKGEAGDEFQKGLYFIKEKILQNSKPDTSEREKIIEFYEENLNRIDKIFKKVEELGKKEKTVFGKKNAYKKILTDFRSVLRFYITKDKERVKNLKNSFANLINEEKSHKYEKLINEIESFEYYLSDSQKIKKLKKMFNGIANLSQLGEFFQNLENLHYRYLELEQYSNIKGMVNSVINPDSLINESKIQYKYKSYDLLLEALIGIYAHIYEDYFGRFSFRDVKKLITSELKVKLNPGKSFNIKLKQIISQLNLLHGLYFLKEIFANINDYYSKFDMIDLKYLLNYLTEYLEESEVKSAQTLIQSFHSPKNFQDFIDYLEHKFAEDSFKEKLKTKIKEFYENLSDYLNNNSKKKPKIPKELYLFKDKNIVILRKITENVTKKSRKFFIKGDHKDTNHISHKYNLKEVPEEEINSLIEDISDIDEYLRDNMDYLLRKISYDPPEYTHRDIIIEKIEEDVKSIIKQEIENNTLSKYDFEDIIKIRICSILNTTHYELPIDIKMYLIKEGRYNGKTVRKLFESSENVIDSFRKHINKALTSEPTFEDLLDRKLEKTNKNNLIFPFVLNVPKKLEKNKEIIFGEDSVWENGSNKFLGFRLPVEDNAIKTYGDALDHIVKNIIYDELESLITLLDRHSKEIHTGFEKIYEKIFQ